MSKTNKKWTEEEDNILLSEVKACPQNLSKCFIAVSEKTGRSKSAVAGHWYTQVSKNPDTVCFFTASSRHYSKNRKNGKGVKINRSIWQRFLTIIRNL